MPIPPGERMELLRAGLIHRWPLYCAECGRPMEPGDMVLCNDGYERIYGEFVLGDQDELHEDNWPQAHAECAREGGVGGGTKTG